MISIKNLTKYYGEKCALDGVSFDVNNGEILGLLGPNGAGKTTTMRILTCYLASTAGSVLVKDFDVEQDPVEVKRLIGYLPESAPLYPDMLTYDYLRFVASLHGLGSAAALHRISELAGICGIAEVMHQPVKELSRGYKQRVGLAHAMMSDPEILVLDEPTAGLDPNQIVHIRSIIKQMGQKKTVIFSTHILSEAEATCDRIVIINKGKVVADGTAESLGTAGLQSQITRIVLREAAGQEAKDTLSRVAGVQRVTARFSDESGAKEVELQVFTDGDRRDALYAEMKRKSWVLLEFGQERQSLEETFRELTRSEAGSKEGAEGKEE